MPRVNASTIRKKAKFLSASRSVLDAKLELSRSLHRCKEGHHWTSMWESWTQLKRKRLESERASDEGKDLMSFFFFLSFSRKQKADVRGVFKASRDASGVFVFFV